MDETTFRDLLARHWTALFDPRTLERGADYQRRGLVQELQYKDDVGEGVLIGTVQGSARDPYLAGVRLEWDGGRTRLDSYCTCPLQAACKHVAATILQELRATTETPAAGGAVAPPQLGAWKTWLDTLRGDAGESATDAAVAGTQSVCAILLRSDGSQPLPALQAQIVRVQPGKHGGYATPQPLQPSWADPEPWRGLDATTFQLVAGLRMRAPAFGGSGGWFRLANQADEPLVDTLLASLPCFFDKVSAGRVAPGPARALRIGWEARDDGTQKLALSVDGAPRARLLKVGHLWYFDAAGRELGRVDGDVRLAEAVLRAPPLLPEQVPLLMERWRDTPLLAALPRPAEPVVEKLRAAPVPVLALRVVSAFAAPGRSYQAGVARLSFDYGGLRLPMFPAPARERRRQGERVVEVARDRAREGAAIEQLEALGLVPAEMRASLRGLPAQAIDDNDFVLVQARSQIAGADQLFALAPRLRELGFRLESGEGFPFELLDAPDGWQFDIDEGAGNAWFDLRLGIDIGGERIDLLPVLHRLLADPLFPLNARKGEAGDATWLVPIDARRRMPLPLTQLRALIAPLLEWLQGPLHEHDGALRLRRAQSDVVEALAPALPKPWRGGERLRAQIERRQQPRPAMAEPVGLRTTLRPYQHDGLAWLGFLADAGLGGILADDMGLGKTVQLLAHLLAEKHNGRLDRPALVLAPTSLVGNWRAEAARFAPDLKVLVVHGPQRHGLHDEMARHDLVITTYPLLLRDHAQLIAQPWSVLVLDEAQAIKNARSRAARLVREIDARQRIAMTGTPLENHLGELWALFDAVEPGLLGDEKHFARFFRTPIEKHADAERQARLNRRIAPLMLRRRKEDVLSELPAKTEIVRRIELEGRQRELYETLRLAQHQRVVEEMRRRGLAQSGIVVIDALLKLRQICCDPRLVKLERARKVNDSAKLDHLVEMLDSLLAEGRRVLVFSQFAQMLALVEQALHERKLPHQTLTGDTPGTQRAALVERFQQGAVPLFLISLKAGGVGLNLTAADTVIHYDPWWNPAVEAQATDRAHRIGQDKPVFVYKLICAGTVEEKIQDLQQRKAELARAVLEGGSTQALRFDESDISELFAPMQ
ncbi:MAG: DEAD/DEAH box helicase [Dokdonella sp.]|uniref:DEAD/DEAH box helicase n=1 Tax=Dokdonella sp. TaxID=2291710 RepID=UPI0025BD3F7D|nr:DEAD/DEAH box helicase [Dokdonella sp.]MBX3701501.1 DEAD/DEAH box helicase [Dokdonella sp.]